MLHNVVNGRRSVNPTKGKHSRTSPYSRKIKGSRRRNHGTRPYNVHSTMLGHTMWRSHSGRSVSNSTHTFNQVNNTKGSTSRRGRRRNHRRQPSGEPKHGLHLQRRMTRMNSIHRDRGRRLQGRRPPNTHHVTSDQRRRYHTSQGRQFRPRVGRQRQRRRSQVDSLVQGRHHLNGRRHNTNYRGRHNRTRHSKNSLRNFNGGTTYACRRTTSVVIGGLINVAITNICPRQSTADNVQVKVGHKPRHHATIQATQ